MISLDKHCTGCAACANACPVNAISMVQSRQGFQIPHIEASKCIGCDLCEKVCPLYIKENPENKIKAYWMYSRNEEIVKKSSSGGVFGTIAQEILKQDGVVYGCAYDSNTKQFICTNTDKVPLEELMRSKYVESYVGMAYKSVKEELLKKRLVLFCGTPCQVAGLRRFLKKDYENLWLFDFSCEGVPAQKLFWDYIQELEKKKSSNAIKFNFRDKFFKWGQHCISIKFDNNTQYREIMELDPYFWTFIFSGVVTRYSCHECKFADAHYSDLILADFWKYKEFPNVKNNDDMGISLVLVQTDKGKKLLDKYKELFVFGEIDLESATYNCIARKVNDNDQLNIEKAYDEISSHGLEKFYYSRMPFKKKIKPFIKKICFWKWRRY